MFTNVDSLPKHRDNMCCWVTELETIEFTLMFNYFYLRAGPQWDYMGKQIVYCNPLHNLDLEKQNATTGRMDCVFKFFLVIQPQPFYDG
jgi:hypothetical protein